MDAFSVRTSGSAQPVDIPAAKAALSILADPQHGVELRGLPSGRSRTAAATDLDALARHVQELADDRGVYYCLNPVPGNLNRAARVGDVIARRWLLIDVDPVRATGHEDDAASEDEHEAARELACRVLDYLCDECGWPLPVQVDSGSGGHLLWRIDLPADKLSQSILKACLYRLATMFDEAGAKIDRAVHNASRIAKLPGTWARKGVNTPERPHRLCRILHCPETIEVVSLEQLQALAGQEAAAATKSAAVRQSPFVQQALASGGNRAYARKALEGEVARIKGATPGGRNNALNRAAYSLGQLVAGGLLLQQDVESRLHQAALEQGLTEREIKATLQSGVEAGRQQPRAVPAPEKMNGQQEPVSNEPLTVCLADVRPQQIDWLMPGRIPRRFITVFAGRTGIGKSFVSHDLIARLSTGQEIPFSGGQKFEPAGALLISEDSQEYVLAPRLLEAGANLQRVRAMTWKAMARYNLADSEMLERAVAEVENVKLVVIDPPTNFLVEADEHKNSEVRRIIMSIVEWLQDRDLAVLFITHVNKQTGRGVEALNRVISSVAWVTTARVAHAFAVDPEDTTRSLWVPMKNNLGQLAPGLAFRIGKVGEFTRVEWLGEVDTTADEAMAGERTKPKRRVEAAEWLLEQFAESEELPSKQIWDGAKGTTISENALKEAKEDLGIKARRRIDPDGGQQWVWIWATEARNEWMQKVGLTPDVPRGTS